ncbi:hypothetical protein P152DRAFT_458839 [Eremomyces bilateralis CBS 781.70]|uniref:Uncharacterized protein n=1 Tax=Eremomyces bilateralis CBS 781.70 TaxID=1392243 RepID=A0A6G1G1J5_9PEZI|nr:uncharacterized protein P152DRAFT_458839 [Eremomyces bilateralis CBS 781.70]KAF1811888.1 hypothetical protein P152DRAFT_458839 [Eremomyces bilateralis CBS 781.70]
MADPSSQLLSEVRNVRDDQTPPPNPVEAHVASPGSTKSVRFAADTKSPESVIESATESANLLNAARYKRGKLKRPTRQLLQHQNSLQSGNGNQYDITTTPEPSPRIQPSRTRQQKSQSRNKHILAPESDENVTSPEPLSEEPAESTNSTKRRAHQLDELEFGGPLNDRPSKRQRNEPSQSVSSSASGQSGGELPPVEGDRRSKRQRDESPQSVPRSTTRQSGGWARSVGELIGVVVPALGKRRESYVLGEQDQMNGHVSSSTRSNQPKSSPRGAAQMNGVTRKRTRLVFESEDEGQAQDPSLFVQDDESGDEDGDDTSSEEDEGSLLSKNPIYGQRPEIDRALKDFKGFKCDTSVWRPSKIDNVESIRSCVKRIRRSNFLEGDEYSAIYAVVETTGELKNFMKPILRMAEGSISLRAEIFTVVIPALLQMLEHFVRHLDQPFQDDHDEFHQGSDFGFTPEILGALDQLLGLIVSTYDEALRILPRPEFGYRGPLRNQVVAKLRRVHTFLHKMIRNQHPERLVVANGHELVRSRARGPGSNSSLVIEEEDDDDEEEERGEAQAEQTRQQLEIEREKRELCRKEVRLYELFVERNKHEPEPPRKRGKQEEDDKLCRDISWEKMILGTTAVKPRESSMGTDANGERFERVSVFEHPTNTYQRTLEWTLGQKLALITELQRCVHLYQTNAETESEKDEFRAQLWPHLFQQLCHARPKSARNGPPTGEDGALRDLKADEILAGGRFVQRGWLQVRRDDPEGYRAIFGKVDLEDDLIETLPDMDLLADNWEEKMLD